MSTKKEVLSTYATKSHDEIMVKITELAESGKSATQIAGFLPCVYDALSNLDVKLLIVEADIARKVKRGFRQKLYSELIANPQMTELEFNSFLTDVENGASDSDIKNHKGHFYAIAVLVGKAVAASKERS